MRVLLISDIHANLPALEAVLKEAEKIGYDAVYCAGDIVGYYPWPNEVTQWVRENADRVVLGNHDAIVAGRLSPEYFSSAAYEAIMWTLEHLTEENKRFISSLPVVEEFDSTCLVHDTPLRPMSMEYIVHPQEAVPVFLNTTYRYILYGHTHIPVLFELVPQRGELKAYYDIGERVLNREHRYMVNPGSVGQPRDGIPLASFLVWDTDKNLLIHRRVDFDKERVLKEVVEKGLPPELGYRLFKGV